MFIDAYLPEKLRGYPFVSTPRWSTAITSVSNGDERRNQNWVHPLHRFSAPESVTCQEQLEDIKDCWYALAGPTHSFAFRDPLDFASRRLPAPNNEPPILLRTDQYLGTFNPETMGYDRAIGDGVRNTFQLVKEYTFGTLTYRRLIYLPMVETILIGIDGNAPGVAPTVDRRDGEVHFDTAPADGSVLTWGGLYDVECRFESDDAYDGIVRSFGVTGAADLSFTEIRPC